MEQKERFELVWKTLEPYLESPEGWRVDRSGDGVPSRFLIYLCDGWTYLSKVELKVDAKPYKVHFSVNDYPEIAGAFDHLAESKNPGLTLDDALKQWAECAAN